MAIVEGQRKGVEHETRWLYSSSGLPVAFVSGLAVYKTNGEFLGCMEGTRLVNGQYIGEIIAGNRLVRQRFKPLYSGEKIQLENRRLLPPIPERLEDMLLPSDFQDLRIE